MQEQETWDAPPISGRMTALPLRAGDFHAARSLRRQRNVMYAPLMGCPPLVIPWLLAMGAQPLTISKEGAHAKRPVTR
jgi:hypothetical protein